MSKYKKALEAFTHIGLCDACGSQNLEKLCEDIIEALEIADRLEQADVINNEEIYIKACRRYGCWESECPYRARDKFCSDLAEIFFDGYNQALTDLRGDIE